MPQAVIHPISISLPPSGAYFAESVHDPRFRMEWRKDPFHKCIYVLHGSTELEPREARASMRLDRCTLAAIPLGVEHRLRDVEPCTLLLLCLAPEFILREPQALALWQTIQARPSGVIHLSQGWQHRLESLWRRAMFEQVANQPGWQLAASALAAQILLLLARLPSSRPQSDLRRRVEFVIQELAGTFFDKWNLDRAAARAGMSRRAFSEHFRQHTGRTFTDHLTSLRLGHAARLLQEGNHSIVGAAFSAGFQDLSHFYRLFRRRYGVTPKAWAARHVRLTAS